MSKSVRKQKGLLERKAKKAQKIALYASYAKEGREKGSRRQKRKARAIPATKHAHLVANCGNTGCESCFPKYRRVRENQKSK